MNLVDWRSSELLCVCANEGYFDGIGFLSDNQSYRLFIRYSKISPYYPILGNIRVLSDIMCPSFDQYIPTLATLVHLIFLMDAWFETIIAFPSDQSVFATRVSLAKKSLNIV